MSTCRSRHARALASWVIAAVLADLATAAASPIEPPDPESTTDTSPAPSDRTGPGDPPTAAAASDAGAPGEVIEVTSSLPQRPGSISVDAQLARRTAGALGEPFRALSLLPGVTTSMAAIGSPIIRGTLPGESRYTFDGIELPMLYHFLLGHQVIHPSLLGDLTLRAGGHGAEDGHLIGGLVAMTPSSMAAARTEMHANLVEIGAFRVQPLSPSTWLAVAARAGTLTIAGEIYDSRAMLYCVDQQTRLVHRLDNGDRLTATSLGAYDFARLPPLAVPPHRVETDKLGFHRLDLRWTRERAGRRLRAGIETAIDSLRRTGVASASSEQGGRSYGVRAYADGGLALAPWLTARGGLHARHRTLVNGASPFVFTMSDPFLGLARTVDAQGAWTALDLRGGPVQVTAGVRADRYHSELYGSSVQHVTVDPRLAIAAELRGVRAELALGIYAAPPQVSLQEPGTVVGPLPMTDGAASLAGMNRATEAQLSVVAPIGDALQASLAAYHRDTRYAVDFGLAGTSFRGGLCGDPKVTVYRDIDAQARGIELMVRRDGRSVTGWLSYSLGTVERDLGFIQLPGDFDQRHTLNAAAQWRHGRWLLGAAGHLHSGRPLPYRRVQTCSNGEASFVFDPAMARRPPISWRIDLRAERTFQLTGAELRLYVELQNAAFRREILSYDAELVDGNPYDPASYRVAENTLLIPLPLVGVELVL